MTAPTAASVQTSTNSRRNQVVRPLFTICGQHQQQQRRFSFTSETVLDCIVNGCTVFVEKAVLLLGPLLILFALTIISGLSWTFFTIIVPMMERDYQQQNHNTITGHIVVGAHIAFVLFLLMEILFNYIMCVITRNKGPRYDQVVRELAEVTGFDYPETPLEVARFRRDFNDKMMLRMRRRRAREEEQQQQLGNHNSTTSDSSTIHKNGAVTTGPTTPTSSPMTLNDNSNSTLTNAQYNNNNNNGEIVTQRKTTKSTLLSYSSSSKTAANKKTPTSHQIRSWMIMAPDEWGFCTRTNQPKPPRSHYDHVTKTLVLCLDHYCPWMFNAVGYFNYRYFCNFLWFVEIAMIYGALVSYRPFVNTSSPQYRKQVLEYRKTHVWEHLYAYTPINTERMPISLSFMLCLAIGIAVACLSGFHLYLIMTAQTTIEFHGNWVNRTKAKQQLGGGSKWRNPYDLGWKRNLQQVYGFSLPFYWAFLIPSTREPEFLPLPLLGEDGKRKHLRKKRDKSMMTVDSSSSTGLLLVDEEQQLLSSSDVVGDIV